MPSSHSTNRSASGLTRAKYRFRGASNVELTSDLGVDLGGGSIAELEAQRWSARDVGLIPN